MTAAAALGTREKPEAAMRIAVLSIHGCPMVRLGGRYRGGMNLIVRHVAAELGERGVQVDVFSRRHDPLDPPTIAIGPNARVIHIDAGPPAEIPREAIAAHIPTFVQGIVAFQEREHIAYDLIHSHYWLSCWAGEALQTLWRVPHAASFHTLALIKRQARRGEVDADLRVQTELRTMESADALVTHSPQDRALAARLYDIDPQKIVVVPAGVDLDRFRPVDQGEARLRLGHNADTPTLLFVGRLEPLKGVDILISALGALEMNGRPCAVLVGEDSYSADELEASGRAEESERKRLTRLAERLGIQERVMFSGAVDHEDLYLYYNAADVCVVPSYYESFGLVAIEAMACGTPVIASRVGGLQSTIRDGETGYLIPWQCPEPFAERLELLLGDPHLARALGARARRGIGRYSWHVVAEQFLALYVGLAFPQLAHLDAR